MPEASTTLAFLGGVTCRTCTTFIQWTLTKADKLPGIEPLRLSFRFDCLEQGTAASVIRACAAPKSEGKATNGTCGSASTC